MERLTDLFSGVLSMGWTALPVMAVVMAVRLLLRRAPRKYVYLLWAVVAFRLVCPMTVSTPLGLVAPETARQQAEAVQKAIREPVWAANWDWQPEPPAPEAPAPVSPVSPRPVSPPVRQPADVLPVLAAVWLAGMAAIAAYVLRSFLRLKRMVRTAVRLEGNVWECDALPTPFVLGLLRPRIYIPFRMAEPGRTYVLAHEREHLRWRDPVVKALALGILAVYWYHPGVWLCWVLLCRDMELRCDEAVLAALGDGVKQDYSRFLLSFALDRRFPAALAFGEHDAARRVKHVLNWKRAKPAAVFLALAAVVLATVVCGTNGVREERSWMRASRRSGSLDRVGEYTYRISEEYQSFLVYQERYDHGELTSRNLLVFGDFGAVTPRRGSCTLNLKAEDVNTEDGETLRRRVWWEVASSGGAGIKTGGVPAGVYGEMGWVQKGQDLGRDTAVAVAAVAEGMSGTTGELDLPEGFQLSERTLENDIVLVLRLRLSQEDADTLQAGFEAEQAEFLAGADALARQLYYAERSPEAILALLGAEETLGRYTVEDAPHGYLSLLFYDCPTPLPDRDTAMWKYSMVLLALLEDYDETTWNWIDNGEKVRETNGGLWNTREWLSANGLGKPIREYGKSPEALRQLLGTLYPEYGGGAAVSETGQALYALRGSPDLLAELLAEPVLGDVSWRLTEDGILEFRLAEPLSSLDAADGGEGVLSDLSCLLLALTDENQIRSIRWLDGGAPVEFSYLHGGDQFMDNAAAIWTEHRSGEMLDVQACGQSPAGMSLLAEGLGAERFVNPDILRAGWESPDPKEELVQAASRIYELSAGDAPDPLIDGLVCGTLWGVSSSEAYRQTLEQGTLLLEFSSDGGDGNRLDQNMARNAAVLLKLRPEITAVRWTYPYGDGTAERTFDTGSMSSVIGLSSNSAVYRQPQSAEDVQALLRFLSSLNDRVFTSALEGRNIPRQEPFTDVLGYDGFTWDLREGVFFSRTWYAVEEGREPFPIASAYGYDPPEFWELDLDGDGQKELICNYVTGGDGHPGVAVYQRREDGVYEGRLNTRDLPGHTDWGVNSTEERYDPDRERFVITYDTADGQREAVFTHAEALERMVWYPSYSGT